MVYIAHSFLGNLRMGKEAERVYIQVQSVCGPQVELGSCPSCAVYGSALWVDNCLASCHGNVPLDLGSRGKKKPEGLPTIAPY